MGDELVTTYYTFTIKQLFYPIPERLAVTYTYAHIYRILKESSIDAVRKSV